MGNHDNYSEQFYRDVGFHTVSRFPIIYDNFYMLKNFPNQFTYTLEKHPAEDVDKWTQITLASTYNLDGSKGIIAIETNRGNYITNDWDYRGLLLQGWEIYTLEEYEKLTKPAQDFAVDILTKEKGCYFDDLDVEIVAEAYIAGYKDAINKGYEKVL